MQKQQWSVLTPYSGAQRILFYSIKSFFKSMRRQGKTASTCRCFRTVQCMPVHHDGTIRFIHLQQLGTLIYQRPSDFPFSECSQPSVADTNLPGCLSERSQQADHDKEGHKTLPVTRKKKSLLLRICILLETLHLHFITGFH